MKGPIQDYFDFSRKEQIGLLFLVSIILACILVINFHDYLFPKETLDISEKERVLIAAIEKEREVKEQEFAFKYKDDSKSGSKRKLAEPFSFDPNSLDESGYVRLGFSEKQAKSIRSYFSKGGKVRKVEDFKKLYVVNDYMYDRLKDHIVVNPGPPEETFHVANKQAIASTVIEEPPPYEAQKKSEARPLVDINSANQEELMALRGIGPKYSERIIKYRDLLGGYSSLDQLGEVYGLKDHPEIIDELMTQMVIGEWIIERININTCEWKDLVRNPYIEKEVANSILAIRETHGEYSAVEEIKRSHLIDEALFEKISPYLTVDSR